MRKVILSIFLGLAMISMSAQQGEMRSERIKQLKIAFITEKLDLSVKNAQEFWPLYNDFEKEKERITASVKEHERKINSTREPSAKELESTIKAISSLKREEILLNEKFTLNCLPVLGAEKTRRLLGVERQFRKKLMEELKERRKDKPGQRRR